MTNLYDFLRSIQNHDRHGQLNLSDTDREFLDQYLQAPDVQIHFKARRVGGTDDDPVMAQDYAIAGDGVDVFSLLTEAMLQNHQFATLVNSASRFYWDHVGNCPDCIKTVKRAPFLNWDFKPHKPITDAKK